MVVEDDFLIAEEIATALSGEGAEIIGPVPDAERAVQALSSASPIHLAVLDVNLNGATTFALADTLRSRSILFVFSTGYGPSTIPARYRDVPRWQKPFDLRLFSKSLAPLLAGSDNDPHPVVNPS